MVEVAELQVIGKVSESKTEEGGSLDSLCIENEAKRKKWMNAHIQARGAQHLYIKA